MANLAGVDLDLDPSLWHLPALNPKFGLYFGPNFYNFPNRDCVACAFSLDERKILASNSHLP